MQSRAAVIHLGLILLIEHDAKCRHPPWLAAFCAIGKSLMFGREDRAVAKWMLGALPGIKLMNLTAASGHHDTNAAWVVMHARRGVFGSGKKIESIKP